jgi:hypothetical protein
LHEDVLRADGELAERMWEAEPVTTLSALPCGGLDRASLLP